MALHRARLRAARRPEAELRRCAPAARRSQNWVPLGGALLALLCAVLPLAPPLASNALSFSAAPPSMTQTQLGTRLCTETDGSVSGDRRARATRQSPPAPKFSIQTVAHACFVYDLTALPTHHLKRKGFVFLKPRCVYAAVMSYLHVISCYVMLC